MSTETTTEEYSTVIGVPDRHRSLGRGLDTTATAPEIPDPDSRSHPLQRDVQQQETHAPVRRTLFRVGDPDLIEHTRRQPVPDLAPGGKRTQLGDNEITVYAVERSLQVRVGDPLSFRVFALDVSMDGLDRVLASPARPESVTFGFAPGLALGLECVTYPSVLGAIGNHGDTEWPLPPVRFRDEHPPHRPRPTWWPMQLDHQPFPGIRGRNDLPVDLAVRRPALRSVTCHTLITVFGKLRNISFCKLRSRSWSPARVAAKILCRSSRTPSSAARQATASHTNPSSSDPFAPTLSTSNGLAVSVSDLSLGAALCCPFSPQSHPVHISPLSRRGTRTCIRSVMRQHRRSGDHAVAVSPRLSAYRYSLVGPSRSRGRFPLSSRSRSAYQPKPAGPQWGFSRCTRMRPDRGGHLPYVPSRDSSARNHPAS